MVYQVLEFNNIRVSYLHALEETFLELVESKQSEPTIIFSRVKPGISISLNQSYNKDIDDQACKRDNIEVTRRKTGGRSMYLDEDHLILSIINRQDTQDISRNYKESIGLITSILNKITKKDFSLEYANDIIVDSKKIGGAAQVSKRSSNLVHCYIRIKNNTERMLKYLKLDGINLEPYTNELQPFLTSIDQLNNPSNFYEKFKQEFLKENPYVLTTLSREQERLVDDKNKTYSNPIYIIGEPSYVSRGNCDVIAGSGKTAELRIKSLEGKVKFS